MLTFLYVMVMMVMVTMMHMTDRLSSYVLLMLLHYMALEMNCTRNVPKGK
jgi:hypothetical protein